MAEPEDVEGTKEAEGGKEAESPNPDEEEEEYTGEMYEGQREEQGRGFYGENWGEDEGDGEGEEVGEEGTEEMEEEVVEEDHPAHTLAREAVDAALDTSLAHRRESAHRAARSIVRQIMGFEHSDEPEEGDEAEEGEEAAFVPPPAGEEEEDYLGGMEGEEGEKQGMEGEEVEEEDGKKPKPLVHYLLDLYGVSPRKERFCLTNDYMLRCLERLTDGHRELILRGSDLVLEVQRRLEDADMPIVVKYLETRPDVITLDLAYNNITHVGLHTLIDFIVEYRTVSRLNVMNNDIGPEGALVLLRAGNSLPLEVLRMSGNPLYHEGGRALALLLKECPTLLYLDVAQTSQTLSSLMYYVDVMRYNNTLLYLNLSRPLGEAMVSFDSAHWADSLSQMVALNSCLRELYLQKSALSCFDVERLVIGLRRNTALLLLDLTANNVGERGARRLSEWLDERPPLVVLLLAHNIISDIGARYLARGLPASRVQLLDLGFDRLTERGVLELLTSLRKATMLRALYLWGNELGHSACLVLRRMLHSTVLQADGLDIEVYECDGRLHAAYRPVDRSNALYYCVPDVRFHRWRWPPPKRRAPEPGLARTCPRRPWAQRHVPLQQRHPDAPTHAKTRACPRHCPVP